MKLKGLLDIQKELRAKINYNEPDRLRCLQVAFLVELGECLNEWKGFKFWSTKRYKQTKNLLEEYIDGLHFLLELGIECKHQPNEVWAYFPNVDTLNWDALCQVDAVLDSFYQFKKYSSQFFVYEQLMQLYLGLGQLFGFSENQIYTAYITKHQTNMERQSNGY